MPTQAELRRATYRARFATYLVNQYIIAEAQRLSRAFPGLFEREVSELNVRERNAVISSVRLAVREAWDGMWLSVTDELKEFGIAESDFVAQIYGNLQTPSKEAILSAISAAEMTLVRGDASQTGIWAKYIRENRDKLTSLIDGIIMTGWQQGSTNAEIMQQIRGTYNRSTKQYMGGLLNGLARNQAEALVRTGASHYSAVARDKTILANTDIIEKRYFLATFDSRTTLTCRGFHGKTWDIDDPKYPRLPLHFNERSQYIFLFEGETEPPGTMASIDGPIDAGTNMGDWLRSQPREFVEDSLGSERAKLFLEGRLPIDKFTDIQGRPLTLEELRETAAGEEAFRRIGGNG